MSRRKEETTMALYRKGQYPAHKVAFDALSDAGFKVDDMRLRYEDGKEVARVSMSTPYNCGGSPIEARCLVELERGEDRKCGIESLGTDVEDLLSAEGKGRAALTGLAGEAMTAEQIEAQAKQFAEAASHYECVLRFEDYVSLHTKPGGAMEKIARLEEAYPDKVRREEQPRIFAAYETYMKSQIMGLKEGNMKYVGKVATPEAAEQMLERWKAIPADARMAVAYENGWPRKPGGGSGDGWPPPPQAELVPDPDAERKVREAAERDAERKAEADRAEAEEKFRQNERKNQARREAEDERREAEERERKRKDLEDEVRKVRRKIRREFPGWDIPDFIPPDEPDPGYGRDGREPPSLDAPGKDDGGFGL